MPPLVRLLLGRFRHDRSGDRPADTLRWYQSSPTAERGFCVTCGSSLFWRQVNSAQIDVAPGALDAPTGLRLAGHIFVADKGDYYDIADGLPQEARE